MGEYCPTVTSGVPAGAQMAHRISGLPTVILVRWADAPRLVNAEELDATSPDQRAGVVREHVVTNLDELPEDFRQRVETDAARLAQQGLRPVTG